MKNIKNMNNNSENYKQAKERVAKIKGFYKHLFVYLFINIVLTGISIYFGHFDIKFNMFSTWFFWGIGVFIHGIKTFGNNIFLGNNWEQRKIEELMQEDKTVKF